jgi:hypothetical protein
MTRVDIEMDYKVVNGRIRNPGKFEGEMLYVPYFWEAYLNGCADSDNRGTRLIKVACPQCGYTVRTTRQWIETGLPVCGPCETPMEEAK